MHTNNTAAAAPTASRSRIVPGYTHPEGLLTAVHPTRREGTYQFWECLCRCGNTAEVRGNHLATGEVKSCGCLAAPVDHTGARYGARRIVGRTADGAAWAWVCDCGTAGTTAAPRAMAATQGCGACAARGHRLIDLSGAEVGNLTVVHRVYGHATAEHQAAWRCVCACGKLHTVLSHHLRNKRITRCGRDCPVPVPATAA